MKRFEPVWSKAHKLRKAIGNKDACYTLEGMIEFNEWNFVIESAKSEQGKRILMLGTLDKSNVTIIVDSIVLQDIEAGGNKINVNILKKRSWQIHISDLIN